MGMYWRDVYSSPMCVNGTDTRVQIRHMDDGHLELAGVWSDADGEHVDSGVVTPLSPGDVLSPLYYATDAQTGEDSGMFEGEVYVCDDSPQAMYWEQLWDGDYDFSFHIEDANGHWLEAGTARIRVGD